MIIPTVGRAVWFWPNSPRPGTALDNAQPMAATVAYVHSDRCVNLSVVDHHGNQNGVEKVLLLQGDESYQPVTSYCQWIPHQVGFV